jgi:hypothetical protein
MRAVITSWWSASTRRSRLPGVRDRSGEHAPRDAVILFADSSPLEHEADALLGHAYVCGNLPLGHALSSQLARSLGLDAGLLDLLL